MKTVKLLDVNVYNLEFSIHKDNLEQKIYVTLSLQKIIAEPQTTINQIHTSQILRLSNFNEQQPNFQVTIDKNFLKTSHVSNKSELQMRSDSVQSINSVFYGENNILRKTLWLIETKFASNQQQRHTRVTRYTWTKIL